VNKLGRMRWVRHIARWGRVEVYKAFWWENLRKSNHLENIHVDGMI